MVLYNLGWFFMVMCVVLYSLVQSLRSLSLYGNVQSCMVLYSHVLTCTILYGLVKSYGNVGSCMVFFDHVWSSKIFLCPI